MGAAAAALVLAAAGVPAAAETIRIEVKGLKFTPQEVTAKVGDTIEWVNDDFLVHTATAVDHEWDVQLPAHQSGSTVLNKPGTIAYFCRFHPNMKGTITVTAP